MSLDLYQDETRERLASLRPVSTPEAGVFDNFVAGSAKMTMRGFAGAASGIDIAGGALASVQDKIMGTGTQAQDQYFKEHDDVFGSAVDYWTPKPNEVGVAAEVVGGLLSTLPMVIMSPAAAIAGTQLGTAEELVKKGVPAEKAQGVGAVQAAGLGLGIWMPILGQNGWQRVLIGGAGYNAAQGVLMRGASAQILEGTSAADEFKAFDGKALTLDVLMGMAFGSLAHLSPSQRQQGAQYWDRLTKWAENLDPSQVDSIAALRQSQHMNVDSVPGKLEGVTDIEAHTQRVKAAIDQLSKGEPVAVDDLRAPAFEEDARRVAASEKNMASLEKTAKQIGDEEGIAPLPEETGAPAGQPRGAEPPPPRGPSEVKPAGAEAIDPHFAKAMRIADENPDLKVRTGMDANGEPTSVTAKAFVEEAAGAATKIREQAKLLAVAAQCMLGVQ